MDLISIVQQIESSAVGEWMRSSVKAMPTVEAIHVMAIAIVFGTILIVDLRMLGLLDKRRAFSVVCDELLPWTWAAFVVAVITGLLMFAANATTYYENIPFRWKMLALVVAGLNMAIFQFFSSSHKAEWDHAPAAPVSGRVAAVLSIGLWTAIIFLGRWIGFTKGYNFDIPEDLDFDFLEFSFNYLRDWPGDVSVRLG